MRPTLSWSDLPGRRVGLYGLGREGEANLRACLALGISPVLVDDHPPPGGVAGRDVRTADDGGLAALARCDVVVKTPGISRYAPRVQELENAGIPVVGGLGLWLSEADRSKVACITGTKGKSTTTAIAGHLLNRLGYRCLVGGNIGVPPYDPPVAGRYDFWVIEVSSYQATDLACSPPVTAVTSLHPDHLPWHRGDEETYYRDKLSACSQPGADRTVANGDSDLLRARRHLLGPRVEWVRADDGDGEWLRPLGLLGIHNRRNALIARAVLRALDVPEADDDGKLHAAAHGFAGLASRLQMIGTVGGVTFVDDSLSTNVLPTLAAVAAFPDRRTAVIVGGQSRGIDYGPLAVGLRARTHDTLLVTMPDNGRDIRLQVERAGGAGPHVDAVDAPDLPAAVAAAYRWAAPDGVVLLSPAAPSFGRFRDYRDRGAAFAAAMADLAR